MFVILMHAWGGPVHFPVQGHASEPFGPFPTTLMPGKAILLCPGHWKTSHTRLKSGRQVAVPPPITSAWAGVDRITGVTQVMAPAAAAFVRKSRRFIDALSRSEEHTS